MPRRVSASVLLLAAMACSGGNSTPTPGPTPAPDVIIGFGGLTSDGAAVSTYTESGFTLSALAGFEWMAATTYGRPAPSIQFHIPAGSFSKRGLLIRASGGVPFGFKSVDLYSSTTRIPYTITGSRGIAMLFTLSDTLSNTLGNFVTVANTHTELIDTLFIDLTNDADGCCSSPMGLDNIVVTR